jgi:hypothetical protein
VQARGVEADRGQHEPADPAGVVGAKAKRDRRAHAPAEYVGPVDAQMVEQGDHVRGEPLDGQRAVHVGGVAVRLQLDRDHPAGLRQMRQHRRERRADGGERAVDQHDRAARAGAVLFVVHLQAVDRCVAHDGDPFAEAESGWLAPSRCGNALTDRFRSP